MRHDSKLARARSALDAAKKAADEAHDALTTEQDKLRAAETALQKAATDLRDAATPFKKQAEAVYQAACVKHEAATDAVRAANLKHKRQRRAYRDLRLVAALEAWDESREGSRDAAEAEARAIGEVVEAVGQLEPKRDNVNEYPRSRACAERVLKRAIHPESDVESFATVLHEALRPAPPVPARASEPDDVAPLGPTVRSTLLLGGAAVLACLLGVALVHFPKVDGPVWGGLAPLPYLLLFSIGMLAIGYCVYAVARGDGAGAGGVLLGLSVLVAVMVIAAGWLWTSFPPTSEVAMLRVRVAGVGVVDVGTEHQCAVEGAAVCQFRVARGDWIVRAQPERRGEIAWMACDGVRYLPRDSCRVSLRESRTVGVGFGERAPDR
ncbi:MAG: hypothetical protein KC619_20115 [Myxococcales bacterium]|nr:hypothetical protein [Myxococcales bacterium]